MTDHPASSSPLTDPLPDNDSATRPAPPDLAPRTPTAREWLRAALRRPPWLAVLAFAAILVAGEQAPERVSVVWLLVVLPAVFAASFSFATWRIRTTEAALVRSGPARRAALDVRFSAAMPPTWSWFGPTGLVCLGRALVFAVALASSLLLASPLAGDRSASAADRAIGWLFLIGGVVVGLAGLRWSLWSVPSSARAVVRAGVPQVVRVLGVEPATRTWHLRVVDGAEDDSGEGSEPDVVVLSPFPGRSRLVAGDVVHLWCAPDGGRRRPLVALTGPFGTLWVHPTVPTVEPTEEPT